MIKITELEATSIVGGGNNFTEYMVHALGRSAALYMKVSFIIFREGPKFIGDQILHGDMTVWK